MNHEIAQYCSNLHTVNYGNKPGKLIFSKYFVLLMYKLDFYLWQKKSVMTFPLNNKKRQNDVTVQQQYICKWLNILFNFKKVTIVKIKSVMSLQ